MKEKFSGQIELTKLQCVILEKKGKTGMVRGLFIPIEVNKLHEFVENRIAIPIDIVVHDEPDRFGQDGFVAQKVDSKTYKAATDAQKEEFKNLPIIGNFKNFQREDNSTPAPVINDETDDLPF
jgi:hypothetical protein